MKKKGSLIEKRLLKIIDRFAIKLKAEIMNHFDASSSSSSSEEEDNEREMSKVVSDSSEAEEKPFNFMNEEYPENEEEEDRSFVVKDGESLSEYSPSFMEDYVAKDNEKRLKDSKRTTKRSKRYLPEDYEDQKETRGDYCGGDDEEGPAEGPTANDEIYFKQCTNEMEEHGYSSIRNNLWWKRKFQNVFDTVINNVGRNNKTAHELFDYMTTRGMHPLSLCGTNFERPPKVRCMWCGHMRKCDYDLDEEYAIGNDCQRLVERFVVFMNILFDKNYTGNKLKALLQEKDNILTAMEK